MPSSAINKGFPQRADVGIDPYALRMTGKIPKNFVKKVFDKSGLWLYNT